MGLAPHRPGACSAGAVEWVSLLTWGQRVCGGCSLWAVRLGVGTGLSLHGRSVNSWGFEVCLDCLLTWELVPLCWPCCVSFLLRAGPAGDGLEAQSAPSPALYVQLQLLQVTTCASLALTLLLPPVEPRPGSLDLRLPSNLRIFFQSMNFPGCLTLVDAVPRPVPSTQRARDRWQLCRHLSLCLSLFPWRRRVLGIQALEAPTFSILGSLGVWCTCSSLPSCLFLLGAVPWAFLEEAGLMDSPSGPSASGQSDCGSLDNSSFGLLHSLDTLRASGHGMLPS